MRPLSKSPTLATLAVLVGVFGLQVVLGIVESGAVAGLFALSAPLDVAPWTIVTNVYAHTGPAHLAANAVALLVVGLILERETTPARYHAFFLATGALAAVAEVSFASLFGPTLPWVRTNVAVMGASGAIFALLGYLLAGNRLAARVAGSVTVSVRAQLVVLLLVAAAITWLTGGARVALVAHFTGLLLGLLAGRAHLLRP